MRVERSYVILMLAALACGGDSTGVPPVTPPLVASVRLSDPPASLAVGQSHQLSAAAFDAAGAVVANPGAYQWTSGAPQVATVDGTGKVVALAAGTSSVSARVAGVTGTTSIVVVLSGQPRDTISTLPQSFVPNLLTVSAGSTVVFAFGGGIPHNVIFDPSAAGRPADILITKDVNIARTFATRGMFKYDCTVHPGMRGEVSVQ
ncbi:MAG: Ig-like domain-containing protein [Gemmatimonadaceae bacterium]